MKNVVDYASYRQPLCHECTHFETCRRQIILYSCMDQIWIWYWLRQQLMGFFKIIIFHLKQSWVVCLTWLELIMKQSVIHSFHQTKSESIRWENCWMLEVINLFVSHVCTSVGSQSNSQTVSQSFNLSFN